MSRDFTDLPTDKLADLKNNENFDRTSVRSASQKSKMKGKSAVKKLQIFLFHSSQSPTKTDRICTSFHSLELAILKIC